MTSTMESPGIIAIVRLKHIEPAEHILEALIEGGIRYIEVTLPTPGSLQAIKKWQATDAAIVGAGTVRTVDDVARAADAGAQFLVTPTTSMPVLEAAQRVGLPVVCGALTPSEIDLAASAAALVKIFPIAAVGGLVYLKAVAAPLDGIGFVPTGGVDVASAQSYAAFGCAGAGIGSALVDEASVVAGQWSIIRDRATAFARAWAQGSGTRV
jgi:2-dehydro-3-deoxyphosphogluconate aldolase/(4S)-4-hydroxy-2-oxoglutarate aldolase